MATVTIVNGTTLYQYDIQDRLKHIAYPTGNYIAYGLDVLNRLSTVTNADGITTYK